jgi:hypothetical protein
MLSPPPQSHLALFQDQQEEGGEVREADYLPNSTEEDSGGPEDTSKASTARPPPLVPPPLGATPTPREATLRAPIRVGFVSRFFKNHAVGLLAQGLIAGLPRDKYRVLLFRIEPTPEDAEDPVAMCVGLRWVLGWRNWGEF